MAEIEINFEHEIFDIEISKEENAYNIKYGINDFFELPSIKNELSNKKFLVKYAEEYEKNWNSKPRTDIFTDSQLKYSKEELEKEMNYEEFVNFISDPNNKFIDVKILNPENIMEIKDKNFLNLIVKDPSNIKKDLINHFIFDFDYISESENYQEFIQLFRKSMEESWKIIENEEFPGTMLKFYKNNELIKSVYIIEEKISFVDFAEEYKKLQLENIKESVEKVNKELRLEGKLPINLEFKEDG